MQQQASALHIDRLRYFTENQLKVNAAGLLHAENDPIDFLNLKAVSRGADRVFARR